MKEGTKLLIFAMLAELLLTLLLATTPIVTRYLSAPKFNDTFLNSLNKFNYP